MKALIVLLIALQTPVITQDAPKWGWRKIASNEYALKPASTPLSFKLPFKEGVRLRFDVSSDFAVTFLVRPKDDTRKLDDKHIPSDIVCFTRHVIKSSATCEMPTDFSLFLLNDERRDASMRETAAQNRISITTSVWSCIESCSH